MGSTSPSSFRSRTTEGLTCSSAAAEGKNKINVEPQRTQRERSVVKKENFRNETTRWDCARSGIIAHLHWAWIRIDEIILTFLVANRPCCRRKSKSEFS